MEFILSVALFAISTSVTPGPNNILVMTSALNFGIRKSIPLLAGICVGFTFMLLVVGLGFAHIFTLMPDLFLVVKIIGVGYLIYLAFVIAISGTITAKNEKQKPLSFFNGALFQWVNAKAWVVVIGAISAFTTLGHDYAIQNVIIAITFLLVSIPCVGIWLLFGSVLQQKLRTRRYLQWFNLSMALLLILSVVPVCIEIWQHFNIGRYS